MRKNKSILLTLSFTFLSTWIFAQCDTAAIYAVTDANAVCFDTTFSKVRNCYSNNYPDHDDSYNSSFTVEASEEEYSMCLFPDTATNFTPLYETTETPLGCNYTYQFGVAINGIGYTPNSNEHFEIIDEDTGVETGEVNIEWHKEARYMFSGKFGNNGGHLNSFGSYHYHDIPVDYFTDSLEITIDAHSSIVGYAADGFPIYYKFVYSDAADTSSSIVGLSSGYSLISGNRPGDGFTAPDGEYTGLYYEDYEYTTTTLDSCNGRWGLTPDYPEGTYYYVLTDNYPYIPRCFKGTVLDNTFRSLSNCPESTASTDCSDGPVQGCMDPFSCNYDPLAEEDDGSCDYNYAYDLLTVESCGTYTSPSGILYNTDGTYADTVVVVSSCDTVYTITLTVNGGTSSKTLTNPSSGGAMDGEISFSSGSGTGPFQFSIDSAATYTAGPPPPSFGGLGVGSYWTVIKDGNGCEMYEEVELSVGLPVELIDFRSKIDQGGVLLEWWTASEVNNSHFEIERSTNGRDFIFIGKLSSHHESQELQSYSFLDLDLEAAQYYYRLKIVDFDGQTAYSKTITIEVNALLAKKEIYFFPNPTSESLIIKNAQGQAVFYNQNGQIKMKVEITSDSFQADIADWPSGKYFIQLLNENGQKEVISFFKVKI